MPYIIERELKVEGVFKKYYHNKLELSTNKSAMNVYVENVETDKRKALRFYDKSEADGMAKFMKSKISKSKVIEVSK